MLVKPASGERMFGLSGVVDEALENTNLSVGTNVVSGTLVPTGELHVITQAVIWYVGTVPTRVEVQALGLATLMTFFNQQAPVSTVRYCARLNVVLPSGTRMRGSITGATAGDTLRFRYSGYKMATP